MDHAVGLPEAQVKRKHFEATQVAMYCMLNDFGADESVRTCRFFDAWNKKLDLIGRSDIARSLSLNEKLFCHKFFVQSKRIVDAKSDVYAFSHKVALVAQQNAEDKREAEEKAFSRRAARNKGLALAHVNTTSLCNCKCDSAS